MTKGPYIPLARSLQEHWLWGAKPYSPGQAWIDLLFAANYTDKTTVLRGEVVTCKRGDVNLSMLELGNRWGWERGKVKRFLSKLEADGMVTVNATTRRTTITIENYSLYNDSRTTERTTDATTDAHN